MRMEEEAGRIGPQARIQDQPFVRGLGIQFGVVMKLVAVGHSPRPLSPHLSSPPRKENTHKQEVNHKRGGRAAYRSPLNSNCTCNLQFRILRLQLGPPSCGPSFGGQWSRSAQNAKSIQMRVCYLLALQSRAQRRRRIAGPLELQWPFRI